MTALAIDRYEIPPRRNTTGNADIFEGKKTTKQTTTTIWIDQKEWIEIGQRHFTSLTLRLFFDTLITVIKCQ